MSRLATGISTLFVLIAALPAQAQVPAPPAGLSGLRGASWTPSWSLAGFYLNTEDPAGPLKGGGAGLDFLLSPYIGVEATLAVLGGVAEEDGATLRREGLRLGGSVLIYPLGLRGHGLNPYLRGGFIDQRMTYTVEMPGAAPMELRNQSSFSEAAAGLRFLFGHGDEPFALSVSVEAAALFPDEHQDGDVTVKHDEPTIVFRVGAGFHF